MSEVQVRLDNRARLVAAVLAAGRWPDMEQAQQRHAAHPHAKATRHFLASFADHPAVLLVNEGLAAGRPVDDYFSAALRSQWPTFDAAEPLPPGFDDGRWLAQLDHFYTDTAIAAFFWSEHQPLWDAAAAGLARLFPDNRLASFLGGLPERPPSQDVVIVPNLLFPALRPVVATTGTAVYLLLPPPKAVGESPPWSYEEGADWVLVECCQRLAALWLAEDLARAGPERAAVLQHAVATLFLEQALGPAEAQAHLVRTRKQEQLPALPAAVEQLRAYLVRPDGRSLSGLAF